MVVAVLDSGVNYNHFDLAPNRWQNPSETAGDGIDNDGNGKTDDVFGYDFVGNGTTPDTTPLDVHGHGTAVAGIIAAAGNNSTGVTGTSWNSKILPVRVANASGTVTLGWVVEGIQYVNGLRDTGVNVRVINGSFGFTMLDSTGISSLSAAIADAGNRETMYVAAAGNSNVNIDLAANQSHPAELSNANIITVAATTDSDTKASFSNWGKTSVDLAAPGELIYTTTYNSGSNNSYGTTTTFGDISGTSFSAPMVAGVAALAFSINPAASVAYVKDVILDNVDVVTALNDPNGDGSNADRSSLRAGGSTPARRLRRSRRTRASAASSSATTRARRVTTTCTSTVTRPIPRRRRSGGGTPASANTTRWPRSATRQASRSRSTALAGTTTSPSGPT